VKLSVCDPATVDLSAAAVASGPDALSMTGGVLSSRVRVMSFSAGTAMESAK
jgi:hypothetical protein